MIGCVITIAPASCVRIAATASGDWPPMNTGAARRSPLVEADQPSA